MIAALMIVLALIVVLAGLAAMLLSWAISQRQVSGSSANQTKAELFARGALSFTGRGFKQEIVNGSTATTVGGTTIYRPTTAADILQVRGILNASDQIITTISTQDRRDSGTTVITSPSSSVVGCYAYARYRAD
jgi:hypothetical protein